MAKRRFTDVEKWDKEWFRDFSSKHKALWQLCHDLCDSCGVLRIDLKRFSFLIGEEITIEDFEKVMGDRVEKIDDRKVWIKDFISFQYQKLSLACKPHKKVFEDLKHNGLEEKYYKMSQNNGK